VDNNLLWTLRLWHFVRVEKPTTTFARKDGLVGSHLDNLLRWNSIEAAGAAVFSYRNGRINVIFFDVVVLGNDGLWQPC
jgi:hypothetical protein